MAGGTDGPPLHTRLLQKLKGDASTDWLSRSIFKVPNHLRRISKQAYEPQVISIGPYHHGKGQLKKMEVYKMFYLKKLLERRPDISLERYVTELKAMEEKARTFYSELLNHIGGEKFVEMMLLDGCFIIELIRKRAVKKLRHKNDHLLTHSILRRVMLDLLLVENQIPFFILSELFDMTVMRNYEAKDFMDIAIEFFSEIMPGSLRIPENQDIKHLLGLVHASSLAPSPDCPEVHISCLPEKVIRSLCPEVMLNALAITCLSSPSKSAEEDEESKSAENRKEQITQMPPPSMAVPLVCSSSPKSSDEVKFPHSDSDNLPFGAAAAPSTNFSQPKSPEELRAPPPKAMTIPSSSLSKSLEEIVSTAAPSVGVSASNSLKGAKSPPSDSSLPRSQEEMDEKAVRKKGDSPSVCFPPSDSSNPFYPEEMGELAVELSELPFVSSLQPKRAAPSLSFPPSDSSDPFYPDERDEPAVELRELPLVRSLPPKAQLDSKRASAPNWKEWRFIRSATELSEAGINFKNFEGRLFDIKFQEGVMLIPTLSFNDDTESILRNLVAYEQCFKDASLKCFTDYVTFMDCLINTGKDVELLCLRGVIDNWLGDQDVVADIFNKLRDSVLISEEDFSYAETFRKVNEHCDRKWNQWKANLWHNYFNTPWAAVSLFAAVFLLLCTALQSVYAVLSYQFK